MGEKIPVRGLKHMRNHACLKTARILGLSVAGLFAATIPAFAHSGTADEQAACTPDVFRLCASEIPSESKIVACLNRKIDKLSPACRKVMNGDDDKPRKKRND